MIAGSTDSGVYLIRTDVSDKAVWTRTFEGAGGESIALTHDGGYVVAGSGSFGTGDVDVYLIKTDASGEVH